MYFAIGAQEAISAQRAEQGKRLDRKSVAVVPGPMRYFNGSNMHCNVGLAIFVKVAPISDRFDGGTQSISMVGTPVSLIPRSSASRRSGSSTAAPHSHANSRKRISGCAQRPNM